MEEQGSFELDKYQMVNGEAQYLGQTMLQKNVKVIKLLLDFDSTSSCLALRAADLGLSGQDGGGGGAGISKNVTHAGSKLTFEMGEGDGAGIRKNVTHGESQLWGRGAGQE